MFKGKESETRALAFSTFRYYLGARFLTTLAVQMQSVAIGWQVYGITGDPLDLGLIGLAQFLPFVVLVLPAGQVADRFNRRTILALCYVAEMICALLLLGFTLFGGTEVWPVFTVLVLFGAARAFAMPSSQAITPNLVPRAAFPNAVAINSSSSHIATIGGPALGGALYVLSPEVVYASVSVTLMLSVLLMFLVRLPVMPRSDEPANWQTLMEGLRFVRSRPI
ncbi:MAG: MFS transporter, partial [Gammaproteobacteria bacterium]|nr:MFS transporter [Gammaproteobacteria bacterium]